MPQDPEQRERRLDAISELLGESPPARQRELLQALRARGFEVTQSSVSRDLRELGVRKTDGVYSLPATVGPGVAPGARKIEAGLLLRIVPAGSNLLVLHTVLGGASRLGVAIDEAQWPEVAGTVAGDDTLFLAIVGARDRKRVEKRLQRFKQGTA